MFEAGAIIWRIQTVGKQVLKQDLNESDQAAKAAGKSLGETAKKTEELGKKSNESAPKVRGVRQEIAGLSTAGQEAARTVGGALLAIGIGVVALTGLAVNAAIEWQTAWTGVTKTVEGTPAELEAVEDGLRDLTKVLPASHQEIAAVAEAAGQLGVRSKDIVAFTRTMIDLGETTNLTSDEAATSLAQLMNIFQTAPEDVGRLGAAVVALGNDGASTERDIVQMSQRIAGAAKIIGLSEGQTLGLANALASVGIEAEAGGSSVSNIMIDIANAVSQKGDKLLKWAELAGMGADEFAEKYRTAPAEALALVIEGMGRLNETGGDVFATLSELGQTDVRVTRSLLGLAGAGDLLRDSLELGNEAWAENTALAEEAAKRYDTTAAKLEIARNTVNDAAIDIGEVFLPAVVGASEAVGGLAEVLGDLPSPVQGAIATVALFGGGLLILGGILLLTVPKIVAFRAAVKTLAEEMPVATSRVQGFAGMLGGPWGVAVLAALTLLGYLTARNAEVASRVKELTTTLDDNTGAYTANTRAAVIARLNQDGVYEAAKRAGIGVDELTDAVMGETDALESVKQKMVDYNTAAGTVERITHPLMNDSFTLVGDAIHRETTALDGARQAWENTKEATEDGADSTRDSSNAYVDAQKEVQGLTQELDSLINLLNEANNLNQDAISANIAYRDAIRDADEAIRNARDGVEGYSLTLDGNTEAGDRNMERLLAIAQGGWDVAQSVVAAGGGVEEFTASLQASRADLIQRAMDFNYTREEAEKLADEILGIPPVAETRAIIAKAQAERDLAAYGATLSAFAGQYASISSTVRVTRVGSFADGGVVEFFAAGGVKENHMAQIAQGGSYRVWAEPETGGEAYIPLSPAKRATSVPVLAETADRFGFELVPVGTRHFSDGGSTAADQIIVARAASAPASVDSDRPTRLATEDLDYLARALAAQMRMESHRGGPTNG